MSVYDGTHRSSATDPRNAARVTQPNTILMQPRAFRALREELLPEAIKPLSERLRSLYMDWVDRGKPCR